MSGKFKAVVFDAFGTLFTYERELWLGSFDKICQEQGLSPSGKTLSEAWMAEENRLRQARIDLSKEEPQTAPFVSYREEWAQAFAGAFNQLGVRGDPYAASDELIRNLSGRGLYPEVKSVLEYIKARWRTGLLTNADRSFLRPNLERHRLSFDVVVLSEGLGLYKPHPGMFYDILEKLGCQPEEVLYVGDSLFDDIQGAKKVGIPVAWVNRGSAPRRPDLPSPDYEVSDLAGLLPILTDGRADFER